LEDLGPLFVHPGDLSDPIGGGLPIAIALVAMLLCAAIVIRGRMGDSLKAVGLVALPLTAFALADAVLLERSKNTDFCMSCHVMEPLLAVVSETEPTLASVHISRGALRTHQSCYGCHSGYGLWGDVEAKLAGVGHMVATVTGRYELPLRIHGRFDIDACLACHAEGVGFRRVSAHRLADVQRALLDGQMGCSGPCHPAAHPPVALSGEMLE
jgi:cytochrome c nitrite reductase small subunit